MRRILCFLSSILSIQAALKTISKANESLALNDWTNYNGVNTSITNTTTMRPYHYIQQFDDSVGNIKLGFDFGGPSSDGYPQGIPTYQYPNQQESRVDSIEDQKIDVSISYLPDIKTSSSVYSSYFQIRYYVRQVRYFSVTVSFWEIPFVNCPSKSQSIIMGLTRFYYFNSSNLNTEKYSFDTCQNLPSFKGTIDLTVINNFLLSKGIVRNFDSRKQIKFLFYFQGVGEVYFNQSKYKTNRYQNIFQTSVPLTNYTLYHKTYNKDYTRVDYSNMSVKVNATTVADVIQQYFYNSVPLPRPNSEVSVVIGYLNTTWVTALGAYQLPIPATANVSIKVSLLYTQTQQTQQTPSDKSFFIMANLRDDFNFITKTFSNNTPNPTSRVVVCYNCSNTYKISDNQTDVLDSNNNALRVVYKGIAYRLRKGKDQTIVVYVFYSETKLGCPVDDDIYAFVRYLRDIFGLLKTESVTSIQTGFKIYLGNGRVYFQDAKFNVTNITSAAYNSNSDVFSWPQKGCPVGWGYSKLDVCVVQDQTSDITSTWFMNARSLGVALRISPLSFVIDEFIYYSYHNLSYDNGIRVISKVCRNYSSSKWIMPNLLSPIQTNYNNLIPDIGPSVGGSSESYTKPLIYPNKYGNYLEWPQFITNTYDFWLFTVPLMCLVFGIFYLTSYLIQCCLPNPIAKIVFRVLKPFRSFVFLWGLLISDNLTYLSFKCFLNLNQFVPLPYDTNKYYAYFSEIVCLMVLFLLIFTVFSLSAMAWSFTREKLKLGTSKQIPGSYLLKTLLMMAKLISGFIHLYAENSVLRMVTLFCLSAFTLFVAFWNYKLIKLKVNIVCQMVMVVAKFLEHLILLIQVLYLTNILDKADNENSLWIFFTVASFTIFLVMLAANIILKLQPWILFSNNKVVNFQQKPKQKKNNQKNFLKHKKGKTEILKTTIGAVDARSVVSKKSTKSVKKCTFNLTDEGQKSNIGSSTNYQLKKSRWGIEHDRQKQSHTNFAKSVSQQSRKLLNKKHTAMTSIFEDCQMNFELQKSLRQIS